MDGGRITHSGTYNELCAAGVSFHSFALSSPEGGGGDDVGEGETHVDGSHEEAGLEAGKQLIKAPVGSTVQSPRAAAGAAGGKGVSGAGFEENQSGKVSALLCLCGVFLWCVFPLVWKSGNVGRKE
jgi:hypothetical protein